MKTTCYCIGCKKHPLHEKRNEFEWLSGWSVGDYIPFKYKEQGKQVNCLIPDGESFEQLDLDPDDFDYPITAYDDGFAATGVDTYGYTLRLYCNQEEHEN